MTVLNTADAIYLGDTPVQRVYLGDTLVWQHPLDRLIALAGSQGAVWIVGVSPAWQDEDRTVPAGDGDPVRVLEDLSGNDYHWIAPNDAARPALVQAGAHWHLLFDGVDDHMTCPSFGTPSWPHDGTGATLAVAVQDLIGSGIQTSITGNIRAGGDTGIGFMNIGTGGAQIRAGIYAGASIPVVETVSELATARLLRIEHGATKSPQWEVSVDTEIVVGGAYSAPPSSDPASYDMYAMRSVNQSRHLAGRWYGACLLPVTGHGDLVDQVLQAHMPPILEPSP